MKINHKVNGGCTREANPAADLSTGPRYHRPLVLFVNLDINGNYCSLNVVQHLQSNQSADKRGLKSAFL